MKEIEKEVNAKFKNLRTITALVASLQSPSMIVTGKGGLGKTYNIKQTIKSMGIRKANFKEMVGYTTARGLYEVLYDNKDSLILIDDCDEALEDKTSISLLKAALDSYDVRTITWNAKVSKNSKYPSSFDFTGSIIFITNLNVDDIDQAILSRSMVVDLAMTNEEKLVRIDSILKFLNPEFSMEVKQDALNYLRENGKTFDVNLRTLGLISKLRYNYPYNWQQLSKTMIK
jgi:hypothetical protein